MIRKLLLPIAAIALLGGCVTSDYAQRHGTRGDYYYGQPRTEYRYHGYDYGYGGYGYPYNSFRYSHYYGYPYGYGGGYYRYPYGPYHPGYRPPVVVHPRPDPDPNIRPPRNDDDDGRAPWRDLDELRRRQHADGDGVNRRIMIPTRPAVSQSPPPPRVERPAPRADSGMGERMRRLNEPLREREVEPR